MNTTQAGNDPTTLAEAMSFVINSATENDLDNLWAAMRNRRSALDSLRAADVSVGDQVRLVGLSPKYLNGLEGVVETIDKNRCSVRLSQLSTERMRIPGRVRFHMSPDDHHYLLAGIPLSTCEVVQDEAS